MKRFLLSVFLLFSVAAGAQVGIGTAAPDTAAVLDVKSTSKALIVPRLTTAAINAIAAPVAGMIVYNTDSGKFWGFGGLNPIMALSHTATAANLTGIALLGDDSVGQTFKPASAFRLGALDLYLSCPNGSNTVDVTIYQGVGFGGPVVATSNSATASTSSSYPPPLQHFVFPTPVTLQANTDYTFEVSIAGSGSANELRVQVTSNSSYAGYLINPAGMPSFTLDVRFAVYTSGTEWRPLQQ